jgi:hypothetical protein
MKPTIKINFSGHPAKGFKIDPLVGVNLPMNGVEELLKAVKGCLDSLPEEVKQSLYEGAKAEIILPGMAPATALLLAEYHGRFGNFPIIRWAIRDTDGFVWPVQAMGDLQSIRQEARTARASV